MYGYRTVEHKIKIPSPPDATRFKPTPALYRYDPSFRPPVSMSKVDHIPALPPKPDNTDPESLLLGVAKRMAYAPPPYNRRLRRKFRKFVRKWCETNLTPLPTDLDFDFEEWLTHTNYSEGRKEEIRLARKNMVGENGEIDFDRARNYIVKLFTKEEYYPEYKHHRGIYAREDAAKALFGPFFHYVEEQVFKLPYFIKKVPKKDRPAYIAEFMLDAALKYQATDYTSFESHFTTDMMRDCEFILYRYMAMNNPKAILLVRLMFLILPATNRVVNKYFTLWVDAKRQSGEMNTSLGNGFSNLMFLLFACEYHGIKYSGPIVEGDDGLIGLSKKIPESYYTAMGCNVKMENVPEIYQASFCGLVYDPDELKNICDPRQTLATCSWVTKKYTFCNEKNYFALLKAKALSMIYEYPGCPIISVLGRKIFDLLHDHQIKLDSDSSYKYTQLRAAYLAYLENKLPETNIGPKTRVLMSDKFNIPVDVQLKIEEEIQNITLYNFNVPSALSIMPDLWVSNYKQYVQRPCDTYSSITHPSFPLSHKYAVDQLIELDADMDPSQELTFNQFNRNRVIPSVLEYAKYLWRFRLSRRILRDGKKKYTVQEMKKQTFFNPPTTLQ